MPARMPFGFVLDCKERARCLLTHPGPNLSADGMMMMREASEQASKDVFKWSYPFKRVFYINSCIIFLLSLLQLLLVHFYLLAVHLSYSPPLPRSSSASEASGLAHAQMYVRNIISSLHHEDKVALGLVVNTALYALLQYELDYITSEFDRLLLPAGLGFCSFHIPQALAFLSPASEVTETLRSFCQATRELYLIFKGAVPEPTTREQPLPARYAPAACTKPASKIGARFISPMTSICEDIQQEHNAMLAEQGRQPRDDVEPKWEYATDTESDYDSDVQHANYVDLTAAAIASVTENVEQWSVVEY